MGATCHTNKAEAWLAVRKEMQKRNTARFNKAEHLIFLAAKNQAEFAPNKHLIENAIKVLGEALEDSFRGM